MPSGIWTDPSGMARAPLADSPNMKAKAISLFIGFSPCIAALRRAIMSRQGSAVKREFGYFFASRHRSSGSASSPRHRRFESSEVSSVQIFQSAKISVQRRGRRLDEVPATKKQVHDGETRQCRRMKFLIQHPAAVRSSKTSMPRSVRAASGGMMHRVCSRRYVRTDFRIRILSFARPSCRWSMAPPKSGSGPPRDEVTIV
jgi:hypothetical protein